MLTFEDLRRGLVLDGLVDGPATLLDVERLGDTAVRVAYRRNADGTLGELMLFSADLARLSVARDPQEWTFDADAKLFQLTAEAQRIRQAHRFDSRLAVHLSDVEPLPHQIAAVYDEMLPRQPLRFLLADDPGAGKTIMAGLLIRELILRGDVERCVIVTPANLAEQWQDELSEKFHYRFAIADRAMFDSAASGNPLLEQDRLIARIDLLKQEEHEELIEEAEWDLVVVDEAHKMSARWNGNDVRQSQRYQLGMRLAKQTRHLLLMTATPHSGKAEDFELFMRLLDPDRFEGKARTDTAPRIDPSDLMRRVLKEELTDFEGNRLFPERRASTVSYELSADERALYDAVTRYVQQEMNRADKLLAQQQGRRKTTVGFALTVLQRRLASSPAAIHESLKRRLNRLQEHLEKLRKISSDRELQQALQLGLPLDDLRGRTDSDLLDDLEERPEEEISELLDLASAAGSIEEFEREVEELRRLERQARAVRRSGDDRKWSQLSEVLDGAEMFDERGARRKLVIFTEHRDTLGYLVERISAKLGQSGGRSGRRGDDHSEAVVQIHGGLNRGARRTAQHAFVNDPRAIVLVATDAAGEGVNLQRAHLMINYDLPWNPNRIEQRFGRIHRFGQREVCHLWNLVAGETREGAVFERLLLKLEEERHALGDRVFDVLGEAFAEISLRELMLEAIRYGDSAEAREEAERQIELNWDHDRLRELLAERSLDTTTLTPQNVAEIREAMDRAEAQRLVPHYVEKFFRDAFAALGGRMRAREPHRYEITRVPAELRGAGGDRRRTRPAPRYERVCFDRAHRNLTGRPQAEFLAPGHPLLDSVVELLIARHGELLRRGAILVDESGRSDAPRALIALEQEIHDARRDSAERPVAVWQSVEYVEIDARGRAQAAGPAPYLDYKPMEERFAARAGELLREAREGWLRGETLERAAAVHASEQIVQPIRDRLQGELEPLLEKTLREVTQRLRSEINYWDRRAREIREKELREGRPALNSLRAQERAEEFEQRLNQRRVEIALRRNLLPQPPRVIGASLVLPAHLLDAAQPAPDLARNAEIERIAMETVLAHERSAGREPRDVSAENLGWDIQSREPGSGELRYIEVKGRRAEAEELNVTRNEWVQAVNLGPKFWLALVRVAEGRAESLELKQDPFGDDPTYALRSGMFNINKVMEDGAVYGVADAG